MVREFSEEKRQEIFRMPDEIDNREWKSFMEWCDFTDSLRSRLNMYNEKYYIWGKIG